MLKENASESVSSTVESRKTKQKMPENMNLSYMLSLVYIMFIKAKGMTE